MKFPKTKSWLLIFISIWIVFAIAYSFFLQKPKEGGKIKPPEARSEMISRENVQQRSDYLHQLLANPKTDEIPEGIREKELIYAKEVSRIADINQLRKNAVGTTGWNQAEVLNWTALGPNNFAGRTRAIALDVTNENIILAAGVSGGVWRSENAGQTWTKTTEPEQLHSVTCIVQDIRPGKENVWYYGTGELVGNSARGPGAPFRGDGIYKSIDGGKSWQPLPSTQVNEPAKFNSPFMYVWDIEINPGSANDEIIAAIFGGIVKSNNGGQTWHTVLGQDLISTPPNTDLNSIPSIFYTDVHRTADNTFYASLSNVTNDPRILSEVGGVYRSTNGENWTPIQNYVTGEYRRTEIGSSASNPNIVYLLADSERRHELRRYNAGSNQLTNLTINVPDGSEEEIEEFESQESYDLFVVVHPANENVVFLGGTNLYRSTDGFTSRNNTSWIGGYNPEDNGESVYPNHRPDQHDLVFLPSNPNIMISTNDGGMFRTENNMAEKVEYRSLNNGYITTQYYTVNMSKKPSDNFAFGGLQDNGSILSPFDGSNEGVRLIGGDGGFTASTRFGVYYYVSFQNGQVYRITLNDNYELTSFARVDPAGSGVDPSQPVLFVNPYVLDPNNGNRMYFTGGDFIWRNKNLSQIPAGSQLKANTNWDRLDRTELETGSISALDISDDQKGILYYGSSEGRLWRIDNANADEDYKVTEITSPNFPEGGYVNSIAVNPTNAEEVLVVFSNYEVQSVFHTVNGGVSFEIVSGNLEENPDGTGNGPSVRWGRIVPKTTGSTEYFLATSIGIFSTSSLNGENTVWNQEAVETIGNVPVNMIDYRRSDGKIVAATHGNGIYMSQVSGVTPLPEIDSPSDLVVDNPFPNPFIDEVTISFTIPETDQIRARVYDYNGKHVKTIALGLGFKGDNDIFWDGTDVLGNPLPAGVYIIRLEYKDEINIHKVIFSRE